MLFCFRARRQWHRNQDAEPLVADDVYIIRDVPQHGRRIVARRNQQLLFNQRASLRLSSARAANLRAAALRDAMAPCFCIY